MWICSKHSLHLFLGIVNIIPGSSCATNELNKVKDIIWIRLFAPLLRLYMTCSSSFYASGSFRPILCSSLPWNEQ